MSYLASLSQMIRTRLLADTGSGGLFGTPPLVTGVFWTVAPVEQPMPHLTYDITVVQQDDAFRLAADDVEVRVHTWLDARDSSVGPVLSRMSEIVHRIIGDWTSQPYGTPPTYGLDRWTVGTVSGFPGPWIGGMLERMPAIIDADADDTIIHHVQPFRLYVSREGA